jgi:ATP-dependent exoDNAse (exonuclease V) alpha subunit
MIDSPLLETEETPELSDEQEIALVKIVQGKNLLITGNAGTGKSTLMRRVVELIGPEVTASTGGFVDRIKSITRETAVMMDIEVPEGNAFIGNVFLNHNSQGMTLDKVETDLSRCFAPGQAYVALSRARSSEGLFLRGTGVSIEAHPAAVKFYQQHCQG